MEPQSLKPWYQKKRFMIPGAIAAFFIVISAFNNPSAPAVNQGSVSGSSLTTPQVTSPATIQELPKVAPVAPAPKSVPESNSGLSNDNYYTNTYGNEVHSPAYADERPAGASAQCRDGTYSFSQSRRGTCSHHGGVAEWY